MRVPVSAPQNIWFDGENVDDISLNLEQSYNNLIESGIINNHFGSGVLPDDLVPNILFDSNLANGLLDGTATNPQAQPSDSSNGNQLAVTLSGSLAAGKRTVKVLIIGLNFESALQYDALTFHVNETQVTSQHYTEVLTIIFNDFIGPPLQSFNLGGRIVIEEASPFQLSRDVITASQNIEPNLFFRDFFTPNNVTISSVLAAALPNYNIDNLNIETGYLTLSSLVENDVSSQIGQKFLAASNNIQKITLLLSVINDVTPTDLVWDGDLLISIYPLQSSVSCPTDIVPAGAINYDPSNIPIAQLSVDYGSLLSAGTTLNTVPQPVDFVFSNTTAASGSVITVGGYYAVTIKRAGSADTCQIQVAVGTNALTTQWQTIFNGSVWTDIPEQSLWFEVWSDSAKAASGQAYDAGHGMVIVKNQINSLTGATQDYVLNGLGFSGTATYYALAQATTSQFGPVQDERTGNNVNSEQQYVPTITMYNAAGLANIQNVSTPFIIGTISDQNVKSFSTANATFVGAFHEYGMVKNQVVMKVVTDPTDGYRYDTNIIELVSNLVNGQLNGAQFIPNVANPSIFYRIARAELINQIYGDVNGDGVVDQNDILALQPLLGANLNVFPSYQQYIVQTNLFANDVSLSWQLVNPVGMVIVASGNDGLLVANPQNGSQANFQSLSTNFANIMNLNQYQLVILNSTASAGNNGSFQIVSLIVSNEITIQKLYYTSDTILQIMRASVDGDMVVTASDLNYIMDYVNLVPPFPATTPPANNVGTPFTCIRLTLEEYVDRADDYSNLAVNRNLTVHPEPDLYLDGYFSFANQNVEFNPIQFNAIEQLVWYDSSVVVNSNPREVPCAFTYESGAPPPNLCAPLEGVTSQTFPQPPAFDPGRNDFFIPNNLVLDFGSELMTPDGYYFKVDFETTTVVIEIPADGYFGGELSVNLFTDFVANYTNTGYTRIGYPAMQFSDCSLVGMQALTNNQVKFAVAVQSFSPQLFGIDPSCIDGVIVDGKIGVSMNYLTGILTLNFTNLYQDPVMQTLNTKIQLTVYLKKAGWNNPPIYMDSIRTYNWLGVQTPQNNNIMCPDPTMIILG